MTPEITQLRARVAELEMLLSDTVPKCSVCEGPDGCICGFERKQMHLNVDRRVKRQAVERCISRIQSLRHGRYANHHRLMEYVEQEIRTEFADMLEAE